MMNHALLDVAAIINLPIIESESPLVMPSNLTIVALRLTKFIIFTTYSL
jgi:hypothetical protein